MTGLIGSVHSERELFVVSKNLKWETVKEISEEFTQPAVPYRRYCNEFQLGSSSWRRIKLDARYHWYVVEQRQ